MSTGNEKRGGCSAILPTWGHARGNGGRGRQASPHRREGSHVNGVGGERRQSLDFVFMRRAVESVCEPRVVLPVHLPGNLIAWKAITELVWGLLKAEGRGRRPGGNCGSADVGWDSTALTRRASFLDAP